MLAVSNPSTEIKPEKFSLHQLRGKKKKRGEEFRYGIFDLYDRHKFPLPDCRVNLPFQFWTG